ncbi:MAG: universal stress protein [Anaerolineae bacterium]|nr:universal stress protein [Anaerolineae bacterium]
MLNHILVPLDGSILAEKAVENAKHILRPDGQFTLVTAVQLPSPLSAYPSSGILQEGGEEILLVENMASSARDYLIHLTKNLRLKGYQATYEVHSGDPASLIVECATRLQVDAITMSTHGRSGINRWLFGSVTLRVLSTAACPVFVIPNRERVEVASPQDLKGMSPHPA